MSPTKQHSVESGYFQEFWRATVGIIHNLGCSSWLTLSGTLVATFETVSRLRSLNVRVSKLVANLLLFSVGLSPLSATAVTYCKYVLDTPVEFIQVFERQPLNRDRIASILDHADELINKPKLEGAADGLPLLGKLVYEIENGSVNEYPQPMQDGEKAALGQLIASLQPEEQHKLGLLFDSATADERTAIALVASNAINRNFNNRQIKTPSGRAVFFLTWLGGGLVLGGNPLLTALVAAVGAKNLTGTEEVKWFEYSGNVEAFNTELNKVLAERQRPALDYIVSNLDLIFYYGAGPQTIAHILNRYQFTPQDYEEILRRSLRTARSTDELIVLFEAGQSYSSPEIQAIKKRLYI